jgi:hypothetical protein
MSVRPRTISLTPSRSRKSLKQREASEDDAAFRTTSRLEELLDVAEGIRPELRALADSGGEPGMGPAYLPQHPGHPAQGVPPRVREIVHQRLPEDLVDHQAQQIFLAADEGVQTHRPGVEDPGNSPDRYRVEPSASANWTAAATIRSRVGRTRWTLTCRLAHTSGDPESSSGPFSAGLPRAAHSTAASAGHGRGGPRGGIPRRPRRRHVLQVPANLAAVRPPGHGGQRRTGARRDTGGTAVGALLPFNGSDTLDASASGGRTAVARADATGTPEAGGNTWLSFPFCHWVM